MEVLIILGLLVVVILLAGIRSSIRESAEQNRQNFLALKKELLELKKPVAGISQKDVSVKADNEDVIQWRPYKAPAAGPDIPKHVEPVKKTPSPVMSSLSEVKEKPVVTESIWAKWLRNNPDLEKFIGENLINKIGIAVLVLGIAFFVKYAIDQNWINETGRVCIGILSGIILVVFAHLLRLNYRSFSSVMAGGGIAVFYFTIAFAFHEYHLFSQPVAFVMMVIITAFATALALLYDKIELAVIAVAGGFLAPFLVSNGGDNYVALFCYLLILNTGMLIISYFKKWPLLHVLSFLFTLLIFMSWLIRQLVPTLQPAFPYRNALFFATAFYVIFLLALMIHNLRTQKKFKAFDFSLMIAITASYYAEGLSILANWNNGAYQGIFTMLLGLTNLVLAWYLYKKQQGDKNLLYLLIGLTVTFISLAAPVQLHGHSITLFWSAESVLLFWLYQRSRMNTFKYFSAFVLIAMMFSLMLDWSLANAKSFSNLTVIFNNWQGIITNIVAIASLGIYTYLLHRHKEETYIIGMPNKLVAAVTAITGILVLFATCIFSVNLYFAQDSNFTLPNTYHQLISFGFIIAIVSLLQKLKIKNSISISVNLISIAFVYYLAGSAFTDQLVTGIIKKQFSFLHLCVHWLAAAFMLFLLYQVIILYKANNRMPAPLSTWLINIAMIIFFSLECKYLYMVFFATPTSIDVIINQYLKAGLTILWATFSFAIMWLGMKLKNKKLRIISLVFFSAALFKLFLFDIRNISEGGKIAAFIMLGILLLVISFMYQRLKKILIDDETKAT